MYTSAKNFKETAKKDKITVCRSMITVKPHMNGHDNMFTGHNRVLQLNFQALVQLSPTSTDQAKPTPYVCVPNVPNEFAGSGYLSSHMDLWSWVRTLRVV